MDDGIGTSIQKGRKFLRRAEEAVMELTSRGCRVGPLELVDENEELAAPKTPAVEVDEDIGKVFFFKDLWQWKSRSNHGS